MTDKIKVVLSGLVFPFTMMHFFWRAFERREDVELFVLGPFTGDYIPWDSGIRLPQKYVKTPQLPLPPGFSNQMLNPSFVEMQLPWTPDLWVQCDAGWRFASRPKAKVVAHIQTDPHVLKDQYRHPKSYSDVNFCMQTPYLESGEAFLPYAHDPTIHFQMEIGKETDGCLIGLHYEHRDRLVQRIRQKGYDIHYSIGEVYDEYRLHYNRSRIALSWSSLLDTPTRVYEAMGMGVPLLANRTPDLVSQFKEGEHFIGFDTLDEAVSQFEMMVNDMGLRAYLSEHAYREVTEKHTWDIRIEQILRTCNLL